MLRLGWVAAVSLALPSVAGAVGGGATLGGPSAVGAVVQGGSFVCSAVLYAPDRAVTAGHCVDALIASDPDSVVRFGADEVPVERVTLHPDHFAAAEADIAVLWLAAAAAPTPIPLWDGEVTEDWDLWSVGVAGWGGDTPDDAGPGTSLRSFAASVEDLTLTALRFDGGDAWVCSGDSGGAVVLDGALAGVVVGGPSECEGPGEAVRIDVFSGFLTDPEGAAGRPFGDDEAVDAAGDGAGALFTRGGEPSFGTQGCSLRAGRGSGWLAAALVLGVGWRRRVDHRRRDRAT